MPQKYNLKKHEHLLCFRRKTAQKENRRMIDFIDFMTTNNSLSLFARMRFQSHFPPIRPIFNLIQMDIGFNRCFLPFKTTENKDLSSAKVWDFIETMTKIV